MTIVINKWVKRTKGRTITTLVLQERVKVYFTKNNIDNGGRHLEIGRWKTVIKENEG